MGGSLGSSSRMVGSASESQLSRMLKCSAHLNRIVFWSFRNVSPSAVFREVMQRFVGPYMVLIAL